MPSSKKPRRKHSPARRRNRITRHLLIEHRNSWGDQIKANKPHAAIRVAMRHPRCWFVTITVWFDPGDGSDPYKDDYFKRYDNCTLDDDGSIEQFEIIRDYILKNEGNPNHFVDWGWSATPYREEDHSRLLSDDQR